MLNKLIFSLILAASGTAYAQRVQDPIKDEAKPGRIYLKWVVDINNDGINDLLVTEKQTPEELKEARDEGGGFYNPDVHGFAVYVGTKDGDYLRDGGIIVDIFQCYVGYVIEVKQYGIVTVETREVTAPSGKGLPVPKDQIYCYTVEGDHLKRKDLTPLLDDAQKSPIYRKYFSDSKRTKVRLQEVTP